MLLKIRLCFCSLALLACACVAHAAQVVLDFNALNGFVLRQTFVEDGFRISPNNHIDAVPRTFYFDSPAIAADSSMQDSPFFVGLPQYRWTQYHDGLIWIDANGLRFDLTGLDATGVGGVISSNGGDESWSLVLDGHLQAGDSQPLLGTAPHLVFSGPQWTNLEWIALKGLGGAPSGFYDNLSLQVPEPPVLALLALGLLALAWTAQPARAKQGGGHGAQGLARRLSYPHEHQSH